MKKLNMENLIGRGASKNHWFSTVAPQYLSTILFIVFLAGLFLAPGAFAQGSLPGSNFEIEQDANLRVDFSSPPSLDWANVDEIRREDEPTGQNDNSFGQGSKEDTLIPSVVTGSIPPNKSDLKFYGVYQEENANGKFLNLFWTRVQDPSGTTNMDFEFNQSEVLSANGVTPVRTAGDLLIVYELSKGGTIPLLFLFKWLDGSEGIACEASNSYPCWGDRTDLTASGAATGSINTSTIPAIESDGLGQLDPRTFGEASIDLSVIFDASQCTSFGSAYLKSRSSDSFTSALKDFIAPTPVTISNCGTVIINKVVEGGNGNETFDFNTDLQTDPADGSSFSLGGGESKKFQNVIALVNGFYTVLEEDPTGIGFDLTDLYCTASSGNLINYTSDLANRSLSFGIEVGQTVECTFTNTARGKIIIAKETNPDGDPQEFDFTLTGDAVNQSFSLSDGETYDSGYLSPGAYAAAETVPDGWSLGNTTCDDEDSSVGSINLAAGEVVTCTFNNTKLGKITIEKQTNPDGLPDEFKFTSNDLGLGEWYLADGEQQIFENLPPGMYSATEEVAAGFLLDTIVCSDVDSQDLGGGQAGIMLAAGEEVTCTFTNSTGAIKISKKAKNASLGSGLHPQDGVTFNVSLNGNIIASDVTDANGEICVSGLIPGTTYTVTEVVPAGYAVSSLTDNPQTVTVSAGATCDVGTPDLVSFLNDPLSEIIVTFHSLAGPGVTKALSVSCSGPTPTNASGELQHGQSATFSDLVEGTYNCTIVVDP